MNKSKIGWTKHTWNPFTGCTKVSSGCVNCYAERVAVQQKAQGGSRYRNGFEFTVHEDKFKKPFDIKSPTCIFVNSMSDLFHEQALDVHLDIIFDTMLAAKQHIFQILTKRPGRMRTYINNYIRRHDLPSLPKHIWVGTSIENNAVLDNRMSELIHINATVRFVSFEPLLGSIDLSRLDSSSLQWAIIGGESGPVHRTMRHEWVYELIKQLDKLQVPVFFKQWGGYAGDPAGGNMLEGGKREEYADIAHPALGTQNASLDGF